MITILLLLFFSSLVSAWLEHSHVQNLLVSILPPNMSHFAVAPSYHPSVMIIFGGLTSSGPSNRTFYINLLKNTTKEMLAPNGPSPRLDPCCHIYNNYFFMTGGRTLTNATPTELWRLDLNADKWQMVANVEYMSRCSLYYFDNETIVLAGENSHNILGVSLISLTNLSVNNLDVTAGSRVQVQSVLWDGTKVNTTIPIENAPPGSILVEESGLILDIQAFHIADSIDPSVKFLSANGNVYNLSVTTSGAYVHYLGPGWQEGGSLQAVSWGEWNIACGLVSGQLQMEFSNRVTLKKRRVSKNSPNYYGPYWPDFTDTHHFSILLVPSTFTGLPGFLLILHNSYKTYILHKDVYLALPPTPTPTGLKDTFFGINTCLPNWRLPHCNTSTCPNSLILQDSFFAVKFECSGHGTCDNGVCICNQNWSGSDCSIYQRSACHGTELLNFPLANCQCMEPTLGGPDCSVKFCPSGCSGHGQCVDGTCSCKVHYSGADCSIMIVDFPS